MRADLSEVNLETSATQTGQVTCPGKQHGYWLGCTCQQEHTRIKINEAAAWLFVLFQELSFNCEQNEHAFQRRIEADLFVQCTPPGYPPAHRSEVSLSVPNASGQVFKVSVFDLLFYCCFFFSFLQLFILFYSIAKPH